MGKKKVAMKRGGVSMKRGGGSMVKKKAGGGSMVKKTAKGGGINQHKRMAMGEAVNMKDGGTTMYSRGYGVGEKGKRTPTTILDGMKKGGRVKKKKQGYKDRKDESIAMRIKKKRTKKQLKASANESYGKFGSKARKKGKINR